MKTMFADLYRRLAELERRADSSVKQGPVAEVDPKAGTVRLRLGGTDDKPFLSPPIPYAQIAGGLKVHAPPTVGQQMTAISGGGDFRQGLAVPMTWSDENKSPSDKGDENAITFGEAKIELRGNEIVVTVPRILFKCGASSIELTDSGLKVVAADVDFTEG